MDYIDHPPSSFRLELIESILSSRFPMEKYKDLISNIDNCEKIISLLQENNFISFKKETELRKIYNIFCQFFKSHFIPTNKKDKRNGEISLKNNKEINERLTLLINRYVRIHPEVIEYLVGRLNNNLPIPSIKTLNEKLEYEEIPTYVQEIFLASWLSRYEHIQSDVLGKVLELEAKNINDNIEVPYKEIKKVIIRHDQAVLKSIQVSEWFDFLIQEKVRPETIKVFTPKNEESCSNNGILVDEEIEKLIVQDKLQIIPLMYFNYQNEKGEKLNQIGTTSIDIRLGTSFQVFYPEQYGIIDFTQNNDKQNSIISSKRINLDFIEGITITPGQFLLGHSMEYVKLPDYICGNLEGRSSFARLGIEIHMTAGYIDPGFEGVMTFEIYNAGPTTVKLYPGMRIGQIRFERNSDPKEKYCDKHTVKYKGLLEHDLSRQSKDWEVELIKNYKKKKGES
jgi:dCTP deaminase